MLLSLKKKIVKCKLGVKKTFLTIVSGPYSRFFMQKQAFLTIHGKSRGRVCPEIEKNILGM